MAEKPRTVAVSDETPPLLTRIQRSFFPAILMYTCIRELIMTMLREPLAMRNLQKFRHHAFALFWLKYGAQMSLELPAKIIELIADAKGLVLDVGPGDGSLVHLFDADKIKMAYGPEPAIELHPRLREQAKIAGLEGRYEPLACGAEPRSLIPALAKAGLIKVDGSTSDGVFDTIMCTRVLCGVHEPEETAKILFTLLKPGGRLIVYEHVANPWPKLGSLFGWIMQHVYLAFGWNLWMGGCKLNRDTFKYVRQAGGETGWKHIDVDYITAWHPVPFIIGTLEKA